MIVKKPEPQPLTLDSLYVLFRRALFWAAVVGAATLLGVVLFVNAANRTANDAKHAIDLANEQREEARLGACNAFNNDLATNFNGLNDEVQKLAVDAFADPTGRRTPEQAALVAKFLEQKRQAFEARKVKPRDCSPQGIKDYYAAKAKGAKT